MCFRSQVFGSASLPTRERELKPGIPAMQQGLAASLPTRERELKPRLYRKSDFTG